ncbi:tetratricopeptide (TPR) repeat protein [Kibdelosporangium banguiense]|uniref:Tetratricopeptide (TPR) repeat protein n=1 Tax=Kibdelosporangium banguiense TaxID=1365924 RepID=A0ABS4TKA6_9PSEU|nr:tetratricopeptide repeat protein [Kibdelosporangium banguiense]MBP2324801.1 tetratricopeptide (TPR) repeat protein [Kibdelosporangium banguiense]
MAAGGNWNRRSALRAMAVLAGTATTASVLEPAMAQATPGGDADALFKAGKFEQAGRAYEEILRKDPANVQAARQRGYVGLLANKFPDAEKYLNMAVTLAPGDKEAHRLLGDCYVRQDKFSLAAPHWQAAGEEGYAKLFAAFRGEPCQVHGDIGRLPWKQMDPAPLVEVSLNGGPAKKFAFYTRVGGVGMSAKEAEEAGLRAVAEIKLDYLDPPRTMYLGILESFRLGGIELRNIPVSWSDDDEPSLTGGAGIFGTWVMYHFLTTIDYAGRSLILRRRTPETAGKARADAERAGAQPLPLWMAHEHIVFSRGSIAGSGPRVMGLNLGGLGEMIAGMSAATAEQLRVRVDYDRPMETSTGLMPALVYPSYPTEVRLGNAVAKDSYCLANQKSADAPHGFDVLGHFSHSFFKPYNVTLDFTDMNLYIVRGKAT